MAMQVFLFLNVVLAIYPQVVRAQIVGLQYCGIARVTRENRCFDSIAKCREFTISGTCRAHAEKKLTKEVWCLYSNRSILWGCYTDKQRCEARATAINKITYQCFSLTDSDYFNNKEIET